jgi:hypothetical protein
VRYSVRKSATARRRGLLSYLVGLQSGKSKFATGVATVGGRTHIGVITKREGFRMLDEPELRHTNIGYNA